MSPLTYFLITLCWLSTVAVLLFWMHTHSPKRRKPVDELEAADAALRNRMLDLEDKYESFVKRLAVRDMRAKRAEDSGQPVLPSTNRADELAALRGRLAAKRQSGAL
jgi:hypothetical protein